MNTVDIEKPLPTREAQFETLITRLRNAGYSLDTCEYNRLRQQFVRGTYGEVV